jgi:hypothetical protein
MSSTALQSQGMTLGISDAASPQVYTSITNVNSMAGPGGSATEIDVTDLSSSAKEFRLGLQDEGEVTCEIQYVPADTQHALLRSLRAAGTSRNFRITFTDSPQTTWTFLAFVKTFSISNAVDGVTAASVALRISGSITEA